MSLRFSTLFVLTMALAGLAPAKAADIRNFGMKSCRQDFCYQVKADSAEQSVLSRYFVLKGVTLHYGGAQMSQEIKAGGARFDVDSRQIILTDVLSPRKAGKMLLYLHSGSRPLEI
jgi:hypothetical protein